LILPVISTLAHLIFHINNRILADTCWALSYILGVLDSEIQEVINTGVTRRLVELLGHASLTVVTPALRTIGNIFKGNDQQTQVVINYGILPQLNLLLKSPNQNNHETHAGKTKSKKPTNLGSEFHKDSLDHYCGNDTADTSGDRQQNISNTFPPVGHC